MFDCDLDGAFDDLLTTLTGAGANVTILPSEVGTRDVAEMNKAAVEKAKDE